MYKMYYSGHARFPSDPDAIDGLLAALLSALEIPFPSGYPEIPESGGDPSTGHSR